MFLYAAYVTGHHLIGTKRFGSVHQSNDLTISYCMGMLSGSVICTNSSI